MAFDISRICIGIAWRCCKCGPNCFNKVNITVKRITIILGFLSEYVIVMLTLHCSLLSVEQYHSSKKQCTSVNLKQFIAKKC